MAEVVAKVEGALRAEVTVLERHPQAKPDRPSRTALKLGEVLSAVGKRPSIESLRFGGPVGDHTVVVRAGHESLAITHTVRSVCGVAARAVEMARRLVSQVPDLGAGGDGMTAFETTAAEWREAE